MKLTEPVNMVTDLLLGSIVVCLAVLLSCHAARTRRTSVWLWAGGFAATALAACSGGIYHGLVDTLQSLPGLILWKTTVLAVGLAGALLLFGCLQSTVGASMCCWLLWGVGVKLGVFVLWMSVHNDFGYVIANYSTDLLAILLLQAYAWWTRRAAGTAWIGAGIAVAFAGALVQRSRMAIGPQFNHNDLYHVIQMTAMWLLYRGAHCSRATPHNAIPVQSRQPTSNRRLDDAGCVYARRNLQHHPAHE